MGIRSQDLTARISSSDRARTVFRRFYGAQVITYLWGGPSFYCLRTYTYSQELNGMDGVEGKGSNYSSFRSHFDSGRHKHSSTFCFFLTCARTHVKHSRNTHFKLYSTWSSFTWSHEKLLVGSRGRKYRFFSFPQCYVRATIHRHTEQSSLDFAISLGARWRDQGMRKGAFLLRKILARPKLHHYLCKE